MSGDLHITLDVDTLDRLVDACAGPGPTIEAYAAQIISDHFRSTSESSVPAWVEEWLGLGYYFGDGSLNDDEERVVCELLNDPLLSPEQRARIRGHSRQVSQ